MSVLSARRGRSRARRHQHRPLRRAAAPLLRPSPVHRHHAPEADDGSGRHPVRRDDGLRRGLPDRVAPPAARGSSNRRRISRTVFAVARSWSQLLGEENAQPEPEADRAGLFSRLRDSLSKSRRALTAELASAAFDPGDDAAWERLEEALIRADVGVPATAELVRRLEARQDLTDLNAALAEELAILLGEPATLDVHADPSVLLVVGVNGTGKTTTIGKLAERLRRHGHSVVLAAADTFRAAAEEQLEIWADRANAEFVGGERGGDPAAVAYDAIETASERGRDVVVVDTAGRLPPPANL